MAQEQEAIDMVTIEMLNDLTHGEEIQLNDKFCLYHYTEDDLIVFNDSEEWEELYVVQWDNETNEITFEKC
jgi:translation elongation factor P/translation initiation factor 5A